MKYGAIPQRGRVAASSAIALPPAFSRARVILTLGLGYGMNSPLNGTAPAASRWMTIRFRWRRESRMSQPQARSRCKTLAKRGLLAVASVLATLLAAEGVARLCLWLKPPTGHVSRWEYRKNQPPAYRGAPFYNTDFLLESMHCL